MTARLLKITHLLLLFAVVVFSAAKGARAAQSPCEEFSRAVKSTYNFKPSRLKDEAERSAKSAAMDSFWNTVKAGRKEFLPCLRAALEDPKSDPWFGFDGSTLLVYLDPSPESKATQVRRYTSAELEDVDLQVWVSTLAQLGAEGFDVSGAGARWLALPKAEYYLPQHGAYHVTKLEGALYIYGSMDEAQATPALVKILNQPANPAREYAMALLIVQTTPEALRALKGFDASGLSPKSRAALSEFLERPKLFEPRAKPKTSREEFLKAFNDIVNGEPSYFFELVEKVPDGEKDVVAVLKPEDLPLVRRVRRKFIAAANPHATEYYDSFTKILLTFVLRTETLK
jgi:hypothetical protein